MQSVEAMLSLLVFLSIASAALAEEPGPRPADDSLYRMQLAGDAWRVLHLRGAFRDLGPEKREAVEAEMQAIGEQTGLCIFMRGIEFTNCRDGRPHEGIASIKRIIIYREGPLAEAKPVTVTFTLSN